MPVVVGPDGNIINTSNIIGSNLIPNLAPNIGALANVGDALIDAPVTNDDGTITLPTIELKSRDPGLAMGELQNIYGTKYMPMFQFIEAQQTGTMTYDPAEDLNMTSEEMDRLRQEFAEQYGLNAEQALLQQQEIARAGQKIAGATAAKAGSAFAQSVIGQGEGASFGAAAKDAFGAINPLGGMMGGKKPNVMLDGKPTYLSPNEAVMQQKIGADIKPLQPSEVPQSNVQLGMNALRGPEGTTIVDRLYGSDAATANFKMTATSAGFDFVTQVAMGADPIEAAKDAGKTAVLSYVANAIIPGSGAIVGFLSKFI